MQQENVELNLVNQKKFDRKFFKYEEKSLLQIDTAQDDLDEADIAAFSQDLSDTADNYQTLSQQEESKKQKAAELKKELAKKKAQLKALQEKKKVELAEKKAKEESLKKLKEKKKKEDEEFQKKIMKDLKIQELTGGNATTIGPTKSVEDMPPVDISAMKAYSAAIEQTAENNQPEEPVNYGTETERKEKETKEVD